MREFKPRTATETSLVQTMATARWHLLRIWGVQTAGFEHEMARQPPSAGTGAVLAAATFRALADNSRVLALHLRFEVAYDRQYNRALAMLLGIHRHPRRAAPAVGRHPAGGLRAARRLREGVRDFAGASLISAIPSRMRSWRFRPGSGPDIPLTTRFRWPTQPRAGPCRSLGGRMLYTAIRVRLNHSHPPQPKRREKPSAH